MFIPLALFTVVSAVEATFLRMSRAYLQQSRLFSF